MAKSQATPTIRKYDSQAGQCSNEKPNERNYHIAGMSHRSRQAFPPIHRRAGIMPAPWLNDSLPHGLFAFTTIENGAGFDIEYIAIMPFLR